MQDGTVLSRLGNNKLITMSSQQLLFHTDKYFHSPVYFEPVPNILHGYSTTVTYVFRWSVIRVSYEKSNPNFPKICFFTVECGIRSNLLKFTPI